MERFRRKAWLDWSAESGVTLPDVIPGDPEFYVPVKEAKN